MDIKDSLEFMHNHGVSAMDLEKVRLAASTLPDTNISLRMKGLDSQSSLILMSRLLRTIAKRLDIEYLHPDVIEEANLLPVEKVSLSPGTASDDVEQECAENGY